MDLSLPERFWEKVNRNGPTQDHMDSRCWEWTGAKVGKGYGRFKMGKKLWAAHRVAFLFCYGQRPEVVCHKCHNPSCVRPDHLYAGDQESNVIDILVNRIRKSKDSA